MSNELLINDSMRLDWVLRNGSPMRRYIGSIWKYRCHGVEPIIWHDSAICAIDAAITNNTKWVKK